MKKVDLPKIFFPLLLCVIAILFFVIYFKPFSNDFPLATFQTNLSFNNTYVNHLLYSKQLKENKFPFWNPNLASGYSILSDQEFSLFNPVNLVVFKFLPFPLSLKIAYLSALLFSLLGTYFFLSSFNSKRIFAFTGALLFVFGGSFISNIASLPHFQSFSVNSWIFLVLTKLVKKISYFQIILVSMLFALQILSGSVDIFLFTFIGAAFYLLLPLFRQKINPKTLLLNLFVLLTIALLSTLLSTIKLFPLIKTSAIQPASLAFFYKNTVASTSLFSFILPKTNSPFSLYFGLTTVFFLTVITLLTKKKVTLLKNGNGFLILLALSCFLTAIPGRSPLYVLYLFPPFYYVSYTTIFFILGSFILTTIVVTFLNTFGSTPKYNKFCTLMCLFIIADVSIFTAMNLPKKTANQIIADLEKDYPIITRLGSENKRVWFILENSDKEKITLTPGNAQIWGVRSINQAKFNTKRGALIFSLLYSTLEFDQKNNLLTFYPDTEKLLALQGVQTIISSTKIQNYQPTQTSKKLFLYSLPFSNENTTFSEPVLAKSKTDLAKAVVAQDFDPQKQVLVEEDIDTSKVYVIKESYYQGMQAEIANRKIKVIPVNINQQGLILEKSPDSPPLLSYVPSYFKTGVLLSLLTLIVCLASLSFFYFSHQPPKF